MQTINVWVNGCFDVIHRGHIELFQFAKSHGHRLTVGIDTDKVVCYGTDQELEKHLVDNEIDTMVIGSDWEGKRVVGEKLVKNLVFFDRIEGYSTTRVLENEIRI